VPTKGVQAISNPPHSERYEVAENNLSGPFPNFLANATQLLGKKQLST
jgi:hypothetical protein